MHASKKPALLRPELLEVREVPAIVALDPTFSGDGVLTQPNLLLNGVAIQPDGRIIVAGAFLNGGADFYVARYNPDGSPDTSFGPSGGSVLIDFGSYDAGNAVALQADGKIVVGGLTQAGTGDFAVARLNPDGSLDASFDGDGKQTVDFAGQSNAAYALALKPDGRIVLGGQATPLASTGTQAIAQLTSDGALDPTFGNNGKLEFASLTPGPIRSLAIGPDGRIVAAGGDEGFFVARVNPDGNFDLSFSPIQGERVVNFGFGSNGYAVAVQPDGKVLVAGTAQTLNTINDFAVARLTTSGDLDPTFGNGGRQVVDLGGYDAARAMILLPAGQILLIGGSVLDIGLVRLTSSGSPDPTFNATGQAVIDIGEFPYSGNAGAVDTSGRLVVAGSGKLTHPPTTNGILLRVTNATSPPPVASPGAILVGGSADGTATVLNQSGGVYGVAGPVPFFPEFAGDVRTAAVDVTGDGVPDYIGGSGPGGGPRVAVIDGATGARVADFFAFEPSFTGGVFVAGGDFDHDGRAEIIVTPDRSGGPRVSIFSVNPDGTVVTRASFFGIDDPAFRGGVRSAAGDVNGDGTPDLAVAAGFGGGPRVALFDGTSLFGGSPTRLVNDFFAFPEDAATLRNGVHVALGDVHGDGFADAIFGGGPGGAPRVLILSGSLLSAGDIAGAYANPVANFFVAGDSTDRGGVRLAVKNADGDDWADIVAGSGEGSPSRVRVYLGKNFTGTGEPAGSQDIDPFEGAVLADGVFVG